MSIVIYTHYNFYPDMWGYHDKIRECPYVVIVSMIMGSMKSSITLYEIISTSHYAVLLLRANIAPISYTPCLTVVPCVT